MRKGRKRGVASSPSPLAGGGKGEGASGHSLLAHARAMRRDATPAERKLWRLLRNHQADGLKFRRQVPLGRSIADYYCAAAKLVVELDGVSHVEGERDAVRDMWLTQHGYHVRQPPHPDPL